MPDAIAVTQSTNTSLDEFVIMKIWTQLVAIVPEFKE